MLHLALSLCFYNKHLNWIMPDVIW